jgi:hypothetical protein
VSSAADRARELADSLAGDVERAQTREEHVRLSARQREAASLAEVLRDLTGPAE